MTEVLRVPPYPITTTWDVPDANAAYTIYVEDLVDHSYETTEVTSTAGSQVEYSLPRAKVQFDRDFLFRVYDTDINGEIVVDSNLTVYRPYIDPNMLGTTASEIAEYKELESGARGIIDAYLGTAGGFYNHKLVIQQVGQGTDYFPIWHDSNRVLRVYENNVLVFDGEDKNLTIDTIVDSDTYTTITTDDAHGYEEGNTVTLSGFAPDAYNVSYAVKSVPSANSFTINLINEPGIDTVGLVKRIWEYEYKVSLDNSAITRTVAGVYNRYERKPMSAGRAIGDLGFNFGGGVAFPSGYDYIFILDVGFKAIPPDVELATKYLIEDLKCGTNDYYKRFVTQYSTEQFDIKFAPQFLEGTGNIIVDKILSNYKGMNLKPGIL